jgi:hypothetical protein
MWDVSGWLAGVFALVLATLLPSDLSISLFLVLGYLFPLSGSVSSLQF